MLASARFASSTSSADPDVPSLYQPTLTRSTHHSPLYPLNPQGTRIHCILYPLQPRVAIHTHLFLPQAHTPPLRRRPRSAHPSAFRFPEISLNLSICDEKRHSGDLADAVSLWLPGRVRPAHPPAADARVHRRRLPTSTQPLLVILRKLLQHDGGRHFKGQQLNGPKIERSDVNRPSESNHS